jgi:putative transposase
MAQDLIRAVGIPKSSFYYRQHCIDASARYGVEKSKIQEIYHQHKGRYGYRRICLVLKQMGYLLNHKTVQKLMGELKLKSVVRVKKYKSYRGQVGQSAPNHLARQFEATHPNEKWVTDVTEFNIVGQKVYLSPILDLYNREIVSFTVDKRPHAQLIPNMLQEALKKLKHDEQPLVHSDQGWQYQMKGYQNTLKQRGMLQSMSRKGNCLDNAAMESFFGVLKSEFYYTKKFTDAGSFIEELKEYIWYYNHERIKTKLKGLSPVQYRNQSLLLNQA